MKKVLQKYWAWAFVVIPLLLQAIFFYVPMFQGAFYSFTNWTGLTYNYKFVGLNNFKLLFMDPKFMNAIGFTAIITIAMVVGEIALGIFIARVLNSKIKGQTFFRAWFFFPAVLSGLTVALIFKQVFNYGLPAIGNALHIEFLLNQSFRDQVGSNLRSYLCSSLARGGHAYHYLPSWSTIHSNRDYRSSKNRWCNEQASLLEC